MKAVLLLSDSVWRFVKEFFKADVINKLLDEHYNGISSNGKKIYTVYTFLIWYKRFFITEN